MKVEIPNVVLQSLICDVYDLKRAIPANIQSRPKDNEGTGFTIGELLDDLIETLESYELIEEGESK
jgi:hypothetical protein